MGRYGVRSFVFVWLIGLLFEFGIELSKRSGELRRRLPEILEDAENGFPGFLRKALQEAFEHYQAAQQKLKLISEQPESVAVDPPNRDHLQLSE